MTLEEIADVILSAAPDAQHYESTQTGNYTAWREYKRLPILSDDVHAEAWAFQVDRFTRSENDSIASALFSVLDEHPRISFSYSVDYEKETRYIHHIFDCEAV